MVDNNSKLEERKHFMKRKHILYNIIYLFSQFHWPIEEKRGFLSKPQKKEKRRDYYLQKKKSAVHNRRLKQHDRWQCHNSGNIDRNLRAKRPAIHENGPRHVAEWTLGQCLGKYTKFQCIYRMWKWNAC